MQTTQVRNLRSKCRDDSQATTMASQFVQIHLRRVTRHNCDVYRIDLDLDVRTEGEKYARIPFRLDSGSDFTTIPISLATKLNIRFSTKTPAYPNTAAGKAASPSYLSPIWFSIPALPYWRFQGMALFT